MAHKKVIEPIRIPEMKLEIPVAPDEEVVHPIRIPEMKLEIPVAPDDEVVHPIRIPEMKLEIPIAPDEEIVHPIRIPEMKLEIPVAQDEEVVRPIRIPEMKLETPVAPDEEVKKLQHLFSEGAWIPSADPLVIGPGNFSELQNLRFADRGLEGVPGYTKINTTAITYGSTAAILNGAHLPTPFAATKSRVIAQAWNSDWTASAIVQNKTAIPSQGNFEGTTLHVDAAGAGPGRFAKWPGDNLAYCNGVETKIYGGDEIPVAAVFTSSDTVTGTTLTSPVEFSDAMRNNLQTEEQMLNFANSVSGYTRVLLIAFTRPVQAIKFYVNTSSGWYAHPIWHQSGASGWEDVTVTTDTTLNGSNVFSTTGTVSFSAAATLAAARMKLLQDSIYFWYQCEIATGDATGYATIYRITGDAPVDDISDVWDGTDLLLPSVLNQKSTAFYTDYTLAASEYSELTPVVLDDLAVTSALLLGSPVPLMGFRIKMMSDAAKVNTATDTAMTVQCFANGITGVYHAVTDLNDSTSKGTGASLVSLDHSGTVSWSPLTPGLEDKMSFNGGALYYYYAISFHAKLSASVEAWYITGIPAPQPLKPYRFPFAFLGRAMLCGYLAGNEANRVDYAMQDTADVWNGPDSSRGIESMPLYFGGNEALTAACEVYNRLGSSIYSFAIFTKDYETYILNGYDATTFRIFPISKVYGCPAPLTMDTYQIGISKDAQSVRSIAMWLSHSGPVMFDSGGLTPVPGLECFFDRRDSRCINSAYIDKSRGWFDPDTGDYNLTFPSGSSQTHPNIWVAFSLKYQKWYHIVPSLVYAPYYHTVRAAFRVADTNGRQYVYGTRDNGFMLRLHDPAVATWDGTASVQSVTLGDMICSGNLWDRIRLLYLKLFGVSTTEDLDAAITHHADGASATTTLSVAALNASGRYFKSTQALNLVAWSHQLTISTTVSTEKRGMRLLGWGLEYLVEREDL